MSLYYIYDPETEAILRSTLEGYLDWMKQYPDARIIKQEHIGECYISTVFLGLDHNFGGEAPMLFETMIFWEDVDELHNDCERCSTVDEARKQHIHAYERVQEYIHDKNRASVAVKMWPEIL